MHALRACALLCVAFAATSSCSTATGFHPGVEVWPHGETFPPESFVACVVEQYAARFPGFDERDALVFDWYDPNDTVAIAAACGGRQAEVGAGCATDKHHIVLSSIDRFPHELRHVHLWRAVGDPDRNHEKHGGWWKTEDEERARGALLACLSLNR